MPTPQGVAPGYIILGFQPIFYPNRRGYAMDKRGRKRKLSIVNYQLSIEEASTVAKSVPWINEEEKENSPLSLGNDPIALRALPLRQGKFLGCSKKLPCFRGAPRRGEGFFS